MQSSITHTLHALLPTYNPPSSLLTAPGQTLPAQLTDLAQALLAQSRSRATNLKADEEIARGYAVCHLAAERLKTKLDLPKIEVRPPCTPKVYKKLYRFLDGTLTTTDPKRDKKSQAEAEDNHLLRTPAKSASGDAAGQYKSPLAVRNAASANRTDKPQNTPTTETPPRATSTTKLLHETTPASSRKRKLDEYVSDDAGVVISESDKKLTERLPDWVAPAIRHLCRTFDAPAAAVPHVFVGTATLFRSNGKTELVDSLASKSKLTTAVDPLERDKLPATLVAVLFLVLERLTGDPNDDVKHAIRAAVEELLALRRVTTRQSGIVVMDARRFLEEDRENWTAMEWYSNIPTPEDTATWKGAAADAPPAAGVSDDGAEHENTFQPSMPARERSKLDTGVREGALLIGLGTMMQDKVDWLSDERRNDYVKWKAGIMKRIAEMQRQRAHPASSKAKKAAAAAA